MAAEARQMERDKIDGVTAREHAGQFLLLLIGFVADPASASSMLRWVGRIKGPQGTPYEGGSFVRCLRSPLLLSHYLDDRY